MEKVVCKELRCSLLLFFFFLRERDVMQWVKAEGAEPNFSALP